MKAFYKVMEKFSKSIKPKNILLSAIDYFEFSVSSPMQESDWLCYEACGCAVTTDHNPISVRNPKVRGTLYPHAIIYLVVWIYSGSSHDLPLAGVLLNAFTKLAWAPALNRTATVSVPHRKTDCEAQKEELVWRWKNVHNTVQLCNRCPGFLKVLKYFLWTWT